MDLLYCGDKNVTTGLFISAYSAARSHNGPINVFVLTSGLTTEPIGADFIEKLGAMLKSFDPESTARLFDLTGYFSDQLDGPNMSTRFTPCCMLRLYADRVDGLPDRLLYLDCDTVALGDIGEIFDTEMKNRSLAGVPDYYGKWFFSDFLKFNYLNSGVLLMDMARIRKSGLLNKASAMCRTKKMFMPDQSALNKLCRDKMKLPRRFNEQRSETKKDTLIRHFTTTFRYFPKFRTVTVKPWEKERINTVLKTTRYDNIITEALRILGADGGKQ